MTLSRLEHFDHLQIIIAFIYTRSVKEADRTYHNCVNIWPKPNPPSTTVLACVARRFKQSESGDKPAKSRIWAAKTRGGAWERDNERRNRECLYPRLLAASPIVFAAFSARSDCLNRRATQATTVLSGAPNNSNIRNKIPDWRKGTRRQHQNLFYGKLCMRDKMKRVVCWAASVSVRDYPMFLELKQATLILTCLSWASFLRVVRQHCADSTAVGRRSWRGSCLLLLPNHLPSPLFFVHQQSLLLLLNQ